MKSIEHTLTGDPVWVLPINKADLMQLADILNATGAIVEWRDFGSIISMIVPNGKGVARFTWTRELDG